MARRHYKMRTRFVHKITRAMFKAHRKIGHQKRGWPYRMVNSYRGLRFMAKMGYPEVDRDIRPDKNGLRWVCHWPKPGLRDDMWNSHVPRGKHFDDMVESEIRSLTSPDHFRYHTVAEDFRACKKYGTNPRIEPKSNRFTLQDFVEMKRDADEVGVKLRGYALPKYWRNVGLMRKAGIPASYLRKR